MSEWLFDLGNTRLKYARRTADPAALPVQHCDFDEAATLPHAVRGETAWVSSVAPARLPHLLHLLRERFARISLARSSARHMRLKNGYPLPEQLGVDRFLALLAASEAAQDILLVGAGTALTIDLLAADGRHLGGLIAPSPTLMRESLHQRVPQLPAHGGQWQPFARNTADALASGCLGMATALIRQQRLLARQKWQLRPALWLHGGGADALLPHLPAAVFTPHLVLHGLALWAYPPPQQ